MDRSTVSEAEDLALWDRFHGLDFHHTEAETRFEQAGILQQPTTFMVSWEMPMTHLRDLL